MMKLLALFLLASQTTFEPRASKIQVMPPLKQHYEYVLEGYCNGAPVIVGKGENFQCKGKDKDHLVCTGITVTVEGKLEDCLQIHVVREK